MKTLKHLALIIYLIIAPIFAQATNLDSLKRAIPICSEDTEKWGLYHTISRALNELHSDYSNALLYADSCLILAEEIHNTKMIITSLNELGLCYRYLDNYDKALDFHSRALEIAKREKLKGAVAESHRNIGLLNVYSGEYQQAAENYVIAIKIWEELKDTSSIANGYQGLGIVYYYKGDYQKTAEYWSKELKLERMLNSGNIVNTLNNLGLVYTNIGEYNRAKELYDEVLTMYKGSENLALVASTLNNIGVLFHSQRDFSNANEYFLEALIIKEKIGNKKALASAYCNVGETFNELENFNEALVYNQKGFDISLEIGDKHQEMAAYETFASIYSHMKKFRKAYEFRGLFIALKDSLLNEENFKQINELQTKYESEKKEAENELLKQENQIQDLELETQKAVIYSSAGGVLALLVLAYFLYSNVKVKQKANEKLTEANQLIEEKNNDITASITYAKQIQDSILPSLERVSSSLPKNFIYYQPRDIVSGDFYFFHEKEDKIFIAAADCTGHGVPGAFVSMMCSNLLKTAIVEDGISAPGKILSEVNKGVLSNFKAEGMKAQAQDGMDISLCVINKENKSIQFSGAINPLIIIRNNEVLETRGDRKSVGGDTEPTYAFQTHSIEVEETDRLYLFSDGYQDQFGGLSGKKLMKKNFKRLLVSISNEPFEEQVKTLHDNLINWQGEWDRLDDILVIGFQV